MYVKSDIKSESMLVDGFTSMVWLSEVHAVWYLRKWVLLGLNSVI